MSDLKDLIEKITEFGTNPNVGLDNKKVVLKNLLVSIYYEFINTTTEFDEEDYPDEPQLNFKEILKNIKSNFPDFGWYSTSLDSNKLIPNAEIAHGDELDDLADIIKDLLEVKWRMENTSKKDAIWHFEFNMRTHSEQHLLDLLKRLKERDD